MTAKRVDIYESDSKLEYALEALGRSDLSPECKTVILESESRNIADGRSMLRRVLAVLAIVLASCKSFSPFVLVVHFRVR